MNLRYAICAFYNLISIPIIKLFTGFRFKCSPLQLVSIGARIDVDMKSIIRVKGRVHAEHGAFLSARGGGIIEAVNFYINRNSMIVCRDKIIIGDGVTIGPNVCIYDHDHNLESGTNVLKTGPIIIGDNVWIGAGCIILKGVTIGNNSVVAAGSVVTNSIDANKIYYNQKKPMTKDRYQ